MHYAVKLAYALATQPSLTLLAARKHEYFVQSEVRILVVN
jgi:hypothetical protein